MQRFNVLARASRSQRVVLRPRVFSTLNVLRQQQQQQQGQESKVSYQSPSPTPPPAAEQEPDNPHRAFYKSFGRPIAKVFLLALFTYQVLRYTWLRLESLEEKEEKQGELEGLEKKLREVAGK